MTSPLVDQFGGLFIFFLVEDNYVSNKTSSPPREATYIRAQNTHVIERWDAIVSPIFHYFLHKNTKSCNFFPLEIEGEGRWKN